MQSIPVFGPVAQSSDEPHIWHAVCRLPPLSPFRCAGPNPDATDTADAHLTAAHAMSYPESIHPLLTPHAPEHLPDGPPKRLPHLTQLGYQFTGVFEASYQHCDKVFVTFIHPKLHTFAVLQSTKLKPVSSSSYRGETGPLLTPYSGSRTLLLTRFYPSSARVSISDKFIDPSPVGNTILDLSSPVPSLSPDESLCFLYVNAEPPALHTVLHRITGKLAPLPLTRDQVPDLLHRIYAQDLIEYRKFAFTNARKTANQIKAIDAGPPKPESHWVKQLLTDNFDDPVTLEMLRRTALFRLKFHFNTKHPATPAHPQCAAHFKAFHQHLSASLPKILQYVTNIASHLPNTQFTPADIPKVIQLDCVTLFQLPAPTPGDVDFALILDFHAQWLHQQHLKFSVQGPIVTHLPSPA